MVKLIIGMLCIPSTIAAQIDTTYQGIKFVEGVSWQAVLNEAKKENKYIFLDCFATWCKPCREMDKDVFSKASVGKLFNKNFLSIRVQMDRTNADGHLVRKWYETANRISRDYGVAAYPSFLFFAPDGNLIYRETGYKYDKAFIEIGEKVLKPGMTLPYRMYYSELAKYLRGERNYSVMAGLADTARQLFQLDLAKSIAKEYFPYILKHKEDWFKPSTLSFAANFINGSGDPFFPIFYYEPARVDSILRKRGYAQYVIDTIIQREEIEPGTHPIKGYRFSGDTLDRYEKQPEWSNIFSKIQKKYSFEFADRNILIAKIKWFSDHQLWSLCAGNLAEYLKKYPPAYLEANFSSILNVACWAAIFCRSVDKEQIDLSIQLMAQIVSQFGDVSEWIDTYANLLYKAGDRQKALRFQSDAATINPESLDILKRLQRMREKKPTWPHYVDFDPFDDGLIDY